MHVHSLDNLDLSAPPGQRLVVLGDPISHSLSPFMHNAALNAMSVDSPELAGWRYEAVRVPADRLAEALPRLHQAGVRGINLTIPHKVRALELIGDADPLSRAMGAVNTLVRTETGYRGTNTDGYGIVQAIREHFDCGLEGADVWIYGAGGAARGIVVACLEAGARRITVLNRSPERLGELQVDLAGRVGIRFFSLAAAPDDFDPEAILVNATSLGLKASDRSPVEPSVLRAGMRVYDTTYGCFNRLASACREAGIPYADGLSMLVWQGVRSLEIWTGKSVPAQIMRVAAENELKLRNQDG